MIQNGVFPLHSPEAMSDGVGVSMVGQFRVGFSNGLFGFVADFAAARAMTKTGHLVWGSAAVRSFHRSSRMSLWYDAGLTLP